MTDKTLRSGGLRSTDNAAQRYATYFEVVPEDVGYEDIFHPGFWRHHGPRLRKFDVVRLAHAADKFDIYVTVVRIIATGVVVDFHGGRPPAGVDPFKVAAEQLADAMKVKTAPIGLDGKPVVRVNHTPKTMWRVLGLNSDEVERNIPTRELAEARMGIYLNEIRMRNPTDDEIVAEMKRRAAEKGVAA
jgi:hypothetical protein